MSDLGLLLFFLISGVTYQLIFPCLCLIFFSYDYLQHDSLFCCKGTGNILFSNIFYHIMTDLSITTYGG